MKIKPNKSKSFYVFCIFFIFVLINSTIVLTISNDYQIAFSQGYIRPPTSTSSTGIQPQSIQQCPQIGIIGPSYTGPDGCSHACPTSGSIPIGCPQTGDSNHDIGNQGTCIGSGCPQPGGIGGTNPPTQCTSEASANGKFYTGLDGCQHACPIGDVIPNGCPQTAKGGETNPPAQCSQIAFSGPSYKDSNGCPRPCSGIQYYTGPNAEATIIPQECMKQGTSNQTDKGGETNPPAQCSQIAFSGPSYKDSNGCPRPCSGIQYYTGPNAEATIIPQECMKQGTSNQTDKGGETNPPTQCSQIAFSGPTYKGQDGCLRPCPNNPNANSTQLYIPECHNQPIGNQPPSSTGDVVLSDILTTPRNVHVNDVFSIDAKITNNLDTPIRYTSPDARLELLHVTFDKEIKQETGLVFGQSLQQFTLSPHQSANVGSGAVRFYL